MDNYYGSLISFAVGVLTCTAVITHSPRLDLLDKLNYKSMSEERSEMVLRGSEDISRDLERWLQTTGPRANPTLVLTIYRDQVDESLEMCVVRYDLSI